MLLLRINGKNNFHSKYLRSAPFDKSCLQKMAKSEREREREGERESEREWERERERESQ